MLEAKEKVIDGKTFIYQPMMTKDARKVLLGIVRRFGGSIASAIENLDRIDWQTVANEEANLAELVGLMTGSVGGVIREFSQSIDEKYYSDLVSTLAKRTRYRDEENREVALDNELIDVLFGANLFTELKWVVFCLGVQYADFFMRAQMAGELAIAMKHQSELLLKFQRGLTGQSKGSQAAGTTVVP